LEKDELIRRLSTAVEEGSVEESKALAEKSIEAGYDPLDVLEGVNGALREVGERFGLGEVFLTDLMFCGEAGKSAMNVLTEEIKRQKKEIPYKGRVLIGTVAGDIHDIGKSLVVALLTAEGFEVMDLGIDVPDETFVEKVREFKPDVLGLSALITPTMFKFKDVVKALDEAGLRDGVKVIIGGASVNVEWTESSRADAFGSDAIDAITKTKALLRMD
jgi:corrinoid protein of di/trimethylamine methyltransferase